MTKEIKLCRDCKHSMPETLWNGMSLSCLHPIVNCRNPHELASARPQGSNAREERSRPTWTITGKSPCGMRGALWEPKP